MARMSKFSLTASRRNDDDEDEEDEFIPLHFLPFSGSGAGRPGIALLMLDKQVRLLSLLPFPVSVKW